MLAMARSLISRSIPSSLKSRIRRKLAASRETYVFKGIYIDFLSAESHYDCKTWDDFSVVKGGDLESDLRERLAAQEAQPQALNPAAMLLPLVASTFKGEVSILDFGGSVGRGYLQVKRSARRVALRYRVVDMPGIANIGANVLGSEVLFSSEIPDEAVDIVNCCSSLQYISDWISTLRSLVELNPEYLLITHTPMYYGDAFVRMQVCFVDHPMPTWVLDIRQIEEIMEGLGYQMVYCARSSNYIDVSNYPEDKQVGWASDLVFRRN